ncbi:hypothetical protein CKO14_07945 [Halorhodospira halophila]|nr:hypothetical protein [Halorhodospira halophila]
MHAIALSGPNVFVAGEIESEDAAGLAAFRALGESNSGERVGEEGWPGGFDLDGAGTAYDLEVTDSHLLVAGDIDGYVTAYDLSDDAYGERDEDWLPAFSGPVRAISHDGDTVYAGGSFSDVDEQSRSNVAAFSRDADDKATLREWNPGAGGEVLALAAQGDEVYIGGDFRQASGFRREHLVAMERDTGRVALDWTPRVDNTVLALEASEDRLFAGGRFENIGEYKRRYLVAFPSDDQGEDGPGFVPEPGDAFPAPNHFVYALAHDGNETLFAGGGFWQVDDEERGRLAAFNLNGGGPSLEGSFNPQLNSTVDSLAYVDDKLYAGGTFTQADNEDVGRVASFNVSSRSLDDSWGVGVGDGAVNAISVADDRVYLGGSFDTVWKSDSGDELVIRPLLASWDHKGELQKWDPQLEGGAVRTIQHAGDDDVLYLGGQFDRVAGRPRGNLAAVRSGSAQLEGWEPSANSEVYTSVLSGADGATPLLFVGGAFSEISDALRSRLAAIRADAGEGDRAETKW